MFCSRVLYVDPNSIRRLTTERSEARRREAWAEAKFYLQWPVTEDFKACETKFIALLMYVVDTSQTYL
jgi:hypothetical protein